MYAITPPTAKLCDFSAPKNQILYGDRLETICKIEHSLLNHGLFNPIIVMKEGPRLIVVDGGKRLTAMRRLLFQGKLPESLKHVPYIVVEQCHKMKDLYAARPLILLANREQYDLVMSMHDRGRTPKEIANTLFITTGCVRDILNIKNLSPSLRDEFINDRLSLDQARALASLENPHMQDVIIRALGPFVEAEDILKAAGLLIRKMKAMKNAATTHTADFPLEGGGRQATAAA